MKKALIALGCLMAAVVASYGQGQIAIGNLPPTPDAPILTELGVPVPAGNSYAAQLYAGPQNSAADALVAVGPVLTFLGAGYLNSPADAVAIPSVAISGTATVQMRAWFTAGGTINSWEAASNLGDIRGESNLFDVGPLGGGTITPPGLAGLQAFELQVVPEPSTIALAVLGAAALLFARRRN